MTDAAYFDYRYKFPCNQTALTLALTGFAALRQAGLLGTGDLPSNMLGSLRDSAGNIVIDPAAAIWRGDPGIAAATYTNEYSGATVNVPARGDPAYYYVWIRANTSPAQLSVAGIDPTTYGLITCDVSEISQVLGVWS